MDIPQPSAEIVTKSVAAPIDSAIGGIVYVCRHSERAAEWVKKAAPRFGTVYPEDASQIRLYLKMGYDAKEVSDWLASGPHEIEEVRDGN